MLFLVVFYRKKKRKKASQVCRFTCFRPQVTSCKQILKWLGEVWCQAECLHQAVCV